MIYVGIDPGVSGGIVTFNEDQPPLLAKMPETESDIASVFSWMLDYPRVKALIEEVHGSAIQKPKDAFTFGRNYGFLRACLTAYKIPFDEVRPQVWQKAMGCLTKGDKNVSKAKAQQLFPQLKITHATADALLIAEYLRRKELGQ